MKRKKTLLEKAKEIPIRMRETNLVATATNEQIELAIGWAKDEIRLGQFTHLLWDKDTAKGVGGKALYTIACWLKAGIKNGLIKTKQHK